MERANPTKQSGHDASSVLAPALKVGAMTGSTGVVVGGVTGVLRNFSPIISATAWGIEWFALGSTYWAGRSIVLQSWNTGSGVRPSEKVSASAISGAVAGSGVALLTRGPRSVLPGGFMIGLFGYAGQHLYNSFYDESAHPDLATRVDANDNFWKRLSMKKWAPFSILSDKEYETMLNEKLLRLDADIAVIDDKIAALRVEEKTWLAAQQKQDARKPTDSS